jgi:succinate dehydrogenase assembly factor 1
VRARDVAAIEHLLRKGSRQLETWEDTGVRDCRISDDMKKWEHGRRIELPQKSQ